MNGTNLADQEIAAFRLIYFINGVTQDIYDIENDLVGAERDLQDFVAIFFVEKEYFEHRLADCEKYIESQPLINKK